ncbi:Gfo/Idh/MocA family protein [Fimbriiglobus ruber]|uniref:Myo-inositol 2-dehydrogenase n=1 Tax=Fimbriiglobus ruber TaxID=1908690 RepID=A0A225D478_9BACT|nr:Gfo/Idh/MocA family oxidoreductase [Fimbriiglobus ruber]OWK36401.1 Myo-inositol 2-dehydrogenase [Fimbriiglobus ruber]
MLSRRTFLGAAAAAPIVLSRASAADKPSDRIALGFIGIGIQGRGHLGGFLGDPAVEVVALCDVVKERLDNAGQMVEKRYADRVKSGAFKGAKSYTDFRKLLDHPGLDAVLIATPDHWHAITCIHAAKAGKHIFCEKPLTQNVAEGRAVVAAVNKSKVVFQTGSQQRTEFGGHFRKAVEYVWNGRIGKLKTIRIGVGGPAVPCDLPTQEVPVGTDWDSWLGPAPERGYNEILCPKGVHKHFPAWRNYQEYAGGGLADMGAHHFDIAQWAMKMDRSGPVEVIPPEDPKKTSGLKYVYANGVVMIHNEFEGSEKADCVFEGTEGKILVGRSGIKSLPESILKEPLGDTAERVYPATGGHHKNWTDCVKSGKPTICTAETGHRSATICHLGNIGYRLHRKLKWDPEKEQFASDAKANKELIREPRAKWAI